MEPNHSTPVPLATKPLKSARLKVGREEHRMRGFYIKTLMVCLLLVFSLVAVGASTQDLLGENLLRTAEELSEWNLWYDVPPNRKEVSLATLAKTGSAAFGSSAVFG